MNTTSKYLIVLAIFAAALFWWVSGKAGEFAPINFSGDGGSGGNNGDGGSGAVAAPTTISFVDFGAMRWIGNDGRIISGNSTNRRPLDTLYNATGFLVPSDTDLSAFKVGYPVRISPSGNSAIPNHVADRGRDSGNVQMLVHTTPNVHYQTGIKDILAIIPAIPGHSSDIRGHWVVTAASWSQGSTGKEPGTLTVL